ncbi:MAG: hypothetical protein EOP60_05005 [Sphingomonadales bacterium]|nr:MAG: hypothetical protein EOP60_05005 [Sphingomonadales bacterium]
MRTISLIGLLMLAGCTAPMAANQASNVTENAVAADATIPAPTPAPAGKLAGVDFAKPVSAFGTEPYWEVEIEPGRLQFTDYSVAEGTKEEWALAAPAFAGNTAVIQTKTKAGVAVTITLTGESCLEVGEEDNRVPLTATVKIGDRTLMGCAGPKRDDVPADNSAG